MGSMRDYFLAFQLVLEGICHILLHNKSKYVFVEMILYAKLECGTSITP